jgi:chromosome segregation ATPase
VLAELQTGVVNARNALENTKAQLRLSQRSVAQLTRQTEDLKEGRERLRLENEGLNSVVARKERLLQEVCETSSKLPLFLSTLSQVLERARKAEADATSLKSQLKTETTNSKKALREMEAALSESTALSQKSEREYITLRDSIQGLVDSWKTDTERLREEMRKREEKWRKEAELVGSKYKKLVEDVRTAHTDRAKVTDLRVEVDHVSKEIEDGFREEIERLKAEVEQSSEDSETAGQIAK